MECGSLAQAYTTRDMTPAGWTSSRCDSVVSETAINRSRFCSMQQGLCIGLCQNEQPSLERPLRATLGTSLAAISSGSWEGFRPSIRKIRRLCGGSQSMMGRSSQQDQAFPDVMTGGPRHGRRNYAAVVPGGEISYRSCLNCFDLGSGNMEYCSPCGSIKIPVHTSQHAGSEIRKTRDGRQCQAPPQRHVLWYK